MWFSFSISYRWKCSGAAGAIPACLVQREKALWLCVRAHTHTHTYIPLQWTFGVMRWLYRASCPWQPHKPFSICLLFEPSIRPTSGNKGHGDQDVVRNGMCDLWANTCFMLEEVGLVLPLRSAKHAIMLKPQTRLLSLSSARGRFLGSSSRHFQQMQAVDFGYF